MSNKIRMIILLILPAVNLHCQRVTIEPTQHGTFIIGGICKDGIVVGSDSRVVLYDNNYTIAAYCEGVKKIFEHRKIVFAMAGVYSHKEYQFAGTFQGFKKEFDYDIPLEQFYDTFLKHIKEKVSNDYYNVLKANDYIIAGYSNGSPKIYWYDSGQVTIFSRGYITNQDDYNNRQDFLQNFTREGAIKISTELNVLLGKIFTSYNSQGTATIGGPPSVAYLINNEVKWLREQNKYGFNDSKELLDAYHAGKIQYTYRSKLDSLLVARMYHQLSQR